jgi:hypothetical protein
MPQAMAMIRTGGQSHELIFYLPCRGSDPPKALGPLELAAHRGCIVHQTLQ